MRVEAVHPEALSDGDIAAWRRMLAAEPELSSPYLTPDWTQLVARHRGGVRVALWRDAAGAAQGFLPVQLSGAFAAMPVGGPICDYQAVIAPRACVLDLPAAAKALGVGRIDMGAGLRNSLVAPWLRTSDTGHVVRLEGGWDAWCANRRAAGTKLLSRARNRLARLTRDHPGAVSIEPFSTDPFAFEALIAWKRDQMRRTRVTDIFRYAWVDDIVRGAFAAPASGFEFGGALFVLRVRAAPVAVLFCLRARTALHTWFVAHDPAFADYSPGTIIFVETIRAAAGEGFTEVDLGPGDYPYKHSLASHGRPIGAGFIGRPGFAARLKAAEFGIRATVETLPVGRVRHWPANAMRRLDIARGLAPPPAQLA